MALGEVALDGSLTSVAGGLLAALAAASRGSGVICPAECGGEAAWAGEVEVIAAPSLLAIVNHFKGTQLLPRLSRGSRRRARPGSTSPM
jgi:magnesium chelatase family protein